jgi:hypothetical protein
MRTRAFQVEPLPNDPNAVLTYDNPSHSWEPYWPQMNADGEGLFAAEVMQLEHVAAFGDSFPSMLAPGAAGQQLATTIILIPCKLLEAAGTDDVLAMQAASYRISTPSVSGQLQFDNLGRPVVIDQPVYQMGADGLSIEIITPYDIATITDVYPAPTWDERVYVDSALRIPEEKVVVAINTLCIAFLVVLAVILVWKRHNPVIKAASVALCVVSLLGGILSLASNYATPLYASTATCAANVWLLTSGFSIMCAALGAKTWRLVSVFGSAKLSVKKISDAKLLGVVGAMLTVDVIINVIWSAASGFPVEVVVRDPLRPAMNYTQCDYDATATGLTYAHIAAKAALMLVGLSLTIRARNLPDAWNEAPYLGASIYNVSLLLVFVVPIVSAQVGGRTTTFIIRTFGVMLMVVSTQSILLIPKFLLMLRNRKNVSLATVAGTVGAGGKTAATQAYQTQANVSAVTPNSPLGAQAPVASHRAGGCSGGGSGGGSNEQVHAVRIHPAPSASPVSPVSLASPTMGAMGKGQGGWAGPSPSPTPQSPAPAAAAEIQALRDQLAQARAEIAELLQQQQQQRHNHSGAATAATSASAEHTESARIQSPASASAGEMDSAPLPGAIAADSV